MKNQFRILKRSEFPLRHWWNEHSRFFAILGLIGFGAAVLNAGVLKIELPPETASFKPAPAAEMANAQCLTCHSVDYVRTQPPFSLVFWTAEVKKMRDKYGASIPEEQIQPLANYLAENYGTESGHQPLAVQNVNPTNAQPITVQALATRYGCLSCHGVNVKIVGPAFHDIAVKYRNDPTAFAKISTQIHNGGAGKWGSVLMPPFPAVTDAQTKMLAEWIMAQGGSSK
jgi:cytochrome c551/c552